MMHQRFTGDKGSGGHVAGGEIHSVVAPDQQSNQRIVVRHRPPRGQDMTEFESAPPPVNSKRGARVASPDSERVAPRGRAIVLALQICVPTRSARESSPDAVCPPRRWPT